MRFNTLFSTLQKVLQHGGKCIKPYKDVMEQKVAWKTLLRFRLIRKHGDNPKKKLCACRTCGEIGHTQEEHKDECPNCEGSHLAEECPTRQITCFLCEGTTHYPAQCHIYSMVQRTVQQKKEAMEEALEETL